MYIVLSQKHLNHALRLETSTCHVVKILKNQVEESEIHRSRICIFEAQSTACTMVGIMY